MTFADIPAGSSVFVDANTFVYHFQPHPLYGPIWLHASRTRSYQASLLRTSSANWPTGL